MLNLIVFLSLFGVAVGNARDRLYYEEKFKTWLKEHSVHVQSNGHYSAMLENFSLNDDIIETHNSQNHTFSLGHNQFSHLSQGEWKTYLGSGLNRRKSLRKVSAMTHQTPADISSLPESVDWVAKGGVTPVKNQGQCGSCWSFSTTGALEGAHFQKYGALHSYSEQNLVDCDNSRTGGDDQGCNGGLMDNAFTWVQKNGGLCYEENYPYTSGSSQKAGLCAQRTCAKDMKAAPKSIVDIEENSDAALMSALALQPVSVAIDASQSSFQLYKSGVYATPCDSNLDHGVLAVGYGIDARDGQKFYKVKNSWGTTWGEGGYIRLARGINQKEGQCGILSLPPSYPVL